MEEPLRQTDQTIHRPPATDLPVLSVAELDADLLGVFRRYRPTDPVVAHEKSGYLMLRYADVERLGRNPRVLSTETAFPEIQGVTEGSLFDGFRYGMLTANGAVHQRKRSPFTRTVGRPNQVWAKVGQGSSGEAVGIARRGNGYYVHPADYLRADGV
jgi:cytochrome P450